MDDLQIGRLIGQWLKNWLLFWTAAYATGCLGDLAFAANRFRFRAPIASQVDRLFWGAAACYFGGGGLVLAYGWWRERRRAVPRPSKPPRT